MNTDPSAMPGALESDPDIYQLVEDNPSYRVLRVVIPPDYESDEITHPPTVTLFLTAGWLRVSLPGHDPLNIECQAGGLSNNPAGRRKIRNIGGTEIRAILVEFKPIR